jgi:hemerythrin
MPLAPPEELELGIPELDDQHRGFYAKINELHDAMKTYDLASAAATADYLTEYSTVHFATEERLMIESGYPGFSDHLARHEEFKKSLRAWRERLPINGPSASAVVDLSSWLTSWLRDHIRKVDLEMARFLRSRPDVR